jgi:hypothetical protein
MPPSPISSDLTAFGGYAGRNCSIWIGKKRVWELEPFGT